MSLSAASQIQNFDSIRDYINIRTSPQLPPLIPTIRFATGLSGFTYESLFRDFLSGQGIPCPQLFSEARETFGNLVDLTQINTLAFRSRVFCWAATGSPLLDTSRGTIEVYLYSSSSFIIGLRYLFRLLLFGTKSFQLGLQILDLYHLQPAFARLNFLPVIFIILLPLHMIQALSPAHLLQPVTTGCLFSYLVQSEIIL